MLLDGAFTALLLIICGGFSDAVPPPLNVTVSCQNLQITVSWDYSKHQPETIFRVNILGSEHARSFEANTTDHQYDISHFVWHSERYLASLGVSVTAVQGGKQSEAVRSKSFSFKRLNSVDMKCLLDFPPVDVHVTERGVSVKFQNPLSFYKEFKRTVKQDKAHLKYTVSFPASSFERKCSVAENSCQLDVPFSDNMEECVTLKGVLFFDKLGIDQIALKETENLCSKKHVDEGPMVLAVLLGSIFVVVLLVGVVVICKVEAWTMLTPIPRIPGYACRKDNQQSFFIPNPEENTKVSISALNKSTLIDLEGDSGSKHPQANNTSGDDSYTRESYQEGDCFKQNMNCEMEGLMSGANGRDEDSADDSIKTECVSISSREEETSPYDCPHLVQMDMGDGDLVIGYTGTENR